MPIRIALGEVSPIVRERVRPLLAVDRRSRSSRRWRTSPHFARPATKSTRPCRASSRLPLPATLRVSGPSGARARLRFAIGRSLCACKRPGRMARCSCQPPNWASNRGAKHRTATFAEVSDRSSCARGGTTFTPLSGWRAQSQAHRVESQSSRALPRIADHDGDVAPIRTRRLRLNSSGPPEGGPQPFLTCTWRAELASPSWRSRERVSSIPQASLIRPAVTRKM
jgi:hypothetical protein